LELTFIESIYIRTEIIVDGVDLLEMLGLKGFTYLPPMELYESLTKHPSYLDYYASQLDEEGKTILFACNCGEINCNSIHVDMIEEQDRIIWENFQNRIGQKFEMASLEFSRANYEDCLLQLLEPM